MKQLYTKLANKIYNYFFFKTSQFRAFFYGFFLKKIGERVYICKDVTILSPQNVTIGNRVYLGKNVTIAGQAGVTIGDYTIINHNVNIISINHIYQDSSKIIREQGYCGGPISIGEDVWIATGAVILQNIKIGNGAVIGANAVVTKNVAPYTLVGGVPARFIRRRSKKTKNKDHAYTYVNYDDPYL